MEYRIRKALLSDIDAIMEIEKSSFIKPIQEKRETFEARIKNSPESFFVFEEDNVFGYICAEFLEKEPESSRDLELNHLPLETGKDFNQKKCLYISSFAILPQKRGCGLGKKLWNESLSLFEKLSYKMPIFLLVNEVWKNAASIYEKSGFFKIGIFKNFFKTETEEIFTDGILMKKEM